MRLFYILLLVLILFLVGCNVQPVCNDPYILVGVECCLDENGNNICDIDEDLEEEPKVESPGEVRIVERIVEKIIYVEGDCRKVDFDVRLEACLDDEITFHNINKGTLHYLDVKLYDKDDELIDERKFRTQLSPYKRRTYDYGEVDKAVRAVVLPTVEFDDEDIVCPEKTFELECYGDEE